MRTSRLSRMIGRPEKTVIDCPDPWTLAGFSCAVPGMQVNQDVDDYAPPSWPEPGHPQQMHLDVRVTDPDDAEAALLALGARRRPDAAESTFRTFLDPAGHPFCIVFGRPPRGPAVPDAAGRTVDDPEPPS